MEWIWIVVPLAGISIAIVAILTEHFQKMAMIEKGITPQDLDASRPPKPEDAIRGGAVTAAVGVALLLATAVGRLSPWLFIPAFICLCVGGVLVAVTLLRSQRPSS